MTRDPRYDVLFEPVKIGPVTAKNRFYQVPHCTGNGWLRPRMLAALRALQQSVGITFVFVTHDQEEALSMADRVAVMSAGKILQIDTPEKLYETPCSREVAAFIGSMNFFDAKVEGVDKDAVIVDAGPVGRLRAAIPDGGAPAPGTLVSVGIRPEKLVLSESPPDGAVNAVRGRLAAASYLGERSHFYIAIDGLAEPLSVARQNTSARPARSADTELWLSWPPDAGIILPADD